VVAVLVRMDDELLGVGRLGSEFVLGTETHLGTQAVDFVGIDILPADVFAALLGTLAADHPGSLVAVGSGTEIEGILPGSPGENLHGTLLDIPETGNHLGVEDGFGAPVQYNLMAYLGSLPPASGQPALHHYRFVPAHIDQGDGDCGAT
jgi:hypothetical protein